MIAQTAKSGAEATKALDTNNLVNSIAFSEVEKTSFRTHGYLKIKDFLKPLAVDALREVAIERVSSSASIGATYGETFSRLSYGLGSSEVFKAIYSSRQFKRTVGELLGTRIIATESNGFELLPGRTGFPWHYGSLSFRFIRPKDDAWSVWLPLDKIDPQKQGGGMAYVSEEIISCAGNYQLSSILSHLKAKDEDFSDLTEGLNKVFGFKGRLPTDIFERHAVEDTFEVGDAFIFHKNVWHRSSPLREGPLKSRLAVNMRFVDWRSCLDLVRYHGEADTGGGLGIGDSFGSQKQTSYGSQFIDIEDGQPLRESQYCGDII